MAPPAASHSRDLTDEQRVVIGPFLPKLRRRTDGRGRPWRDNRAVLNGVLRILRNRWKIERLFAWFQNFRRLVVRYERFAENFLGIATPGLRLILLRGL